MNKLNELKYMKSFVCGTLFDEELNCDLLRCLWTAYCLHYGMDVNTAWYDSDLTEVWEALDEYDKDVAEWCDYDSFERFMSRYLR